MSEQIDAPKVSILIPVFNREEFIADCIQSALDQTYTDLEVVVVDNASDDGTWEICQRYAALDKRVRAFRNDKNVGPVRNWLACVEKARGEYGKLLFSDDLMFPRFLERTLPYLEDTEIGFVSTAALIGTTVQEGEMWFGNLGSEPRLRTEYYFKLLLRGRVPYSPGAAIFRLADMRANLRLSFPTCVPRDFTINGAGPDVMLYALTALNYRYVAMLPTADVFFRAHPGSFTMANVNNEVEEGYAASLAWFCSAKLTKHQWMEYIARAWVFKPRNSRRFISVVEYSMRHEGTGDAVETLGIGVMAARILLKSSLKHARKRLRSWLISP